LIDNWIPIKKYFREKGKDKTSNIIWKFVEKESESLTLAECFIYFVQQFMNIFLPSLNILQNDKTQCTQIYTEMTIVRNKLKSRIENKYYDHK